MESQQAEAFFGAVITLLTELQVTQAEAIDRAAEIVAEVTRRDGLVHLFGTGHSHLLAEECFYRAGSFANFSAILEPSLMLHSGASTSSRLERLAGWAEILLKKHEAKPPDALIVISNSGCNAVPIEMAIAGKEAGLPVIALTSLAQSKAAPTRHHSGRRLFELADVVLDNGGPLGDALVAVDESGLMMGPVSTIAGATLLHQVAISAARKLRAAGIQPPVYVSANSTGGDQANAQLLEKYRRRIRQL